MNKYFLWRSSWLRNLEAGCITSSSRSSVSSSSSSSFFLLLLFMSDSFFISGSHFSLRNTRPVSGCWRSSDSLRIRSLSAHCTHKHLLSLQSVKWITPCQHLKIHCSIGSIKIMKNLDVDDEVWWHSEAFNQVYLFLYLQVFLWHWWQTGQNITCSTAIQTSHYTYIYIYIYIYISAIERFTCLFICLTNNFYSVMLFQLCHTLTIMFYIRWLEPVSN